MKLPGWATFLSALLLGLAAFVAVEAAFSPGFQDCIGGAQNPYNSNPPEQHAPRFKPGSPTAFVECTGGYVQSYGVAIGALGTLVIAAFTYTLWVATSRQAQLTRDAMIADQRAFVFASGIGSYWERDAATGQYCWRFRAGIKNSGRTPSKNLRIYCDCEVRNSLLPAGHKFQDQPGHETTGLAPPGESVTGPVAPRSPIPPITPQDIVDAQNGRKHIYLWGYAKYLDVFEGTQEHITRFRWLVTALGTPFTYDPAAAAAPHAAGTPGTLDFGYVQAAEGNCADDECG